MLAKVGFVPSASQASIISVVGASSVELQAIIAALTSSKAEVAFAWKLSVTSWPIIDSQFTFSINCTIPNFLSAVSTSNSIAVLLPVGTSLSVWLISTMSLPSETILYISIIAAPSLFALENGVVAVIAVPLCA